MAPLQIGSEKGCHKRKVHYLSWKTSHGIRVPCEKGNVDTIKDGEEGNERNIALWNKTNCLFKSLFNQWESCNTLFLKKKISTDAWLNGWLSNNCSFTVDQRVEKWALLKGCCVNPSQASAGETGFSGCAISGSQTQCLQLKQEPVGQVFRSDVQKQNCWSIKNSHEQRRKENWWR